MNIKSGKQRKSTVIVAELDSYEKDSEDIKLDSQAKKCRHIIKLYKNNKLTKPQLMMLFTIIVDENITWEKLEMLIRMGK